MSGKNEQNPSLSANGFKYSDSTGSLASKARAAGEYNLARAGLAEDAEKKIRELLPLFRKENVPDEFKKDRADIMLGLTSVIGDLYSIGVDWRSYTRIYTSRTDNDQEKAIDANDKEESGAAALIAQLKKCIGHFEELETLGLSKFMSFSEAFAVVKNILGHYEEMTNGSLSVPENAKNHIIAHDPKVNTSGKNLKKDIVSERSAYIDKKDFLLFPHEPSPDDIIQGSIGDCWLVSTLSAICVNNPQAIRDMIRDNKDGTVTVRLYEEKNNSYIPHYVTVEKTVPKKVARKTDGIEGSKTVANNGSLWVQMIEKAYAASGIHKGRFNAENKTADMENITGGYSANAMNALFGGLNVDHKEIHSNISDDEFFMTVRDAVTEKRVITCATSQYFLRSSNLNEKYRKKAEEFRKANKRSPNEDEKKEMAEEVSYGLSVKKVSDFPSAGITYENHAYTIINAFEESGEKYIVVRNPHADKSYNALTGGKKDNTAGYSTIPLNEYRKLFHQVIISTPIAAAGYKNPAKEIADLTITMINTFDKSRSIASYITFRHSMSDQFRDMYGAMETVNNIANSKAPSKLALTRAFADLSSKAETYLHYTETQKDNSNDRNLRVTIARACRSLAEAYKNSEGEALASGVTDITRNILKDRILYVSSVSKDNAIRRMGSAEAINNAVEKLKDKDLYTSITQINDYAKTVSEENTAKVKPAEPKQSAGAGINA